LQSIANPKGEIIMALYRKKPVVVEASVWHKNGDHPKDYANDMEGFEEGQLKLFPASLCKQLQWEGQVVRYYRTPALDGQDKCKHCGDIMHNHGWIDTLEGGHIVCPGDFIITGVVGEMCSCKPKVFEATYEPVIMSDAERKEFVEGITRHMR